MPQVNGSLTCKASRVPKARDWVCAFEVVGAVPCWVSSIGRATDL